MPLDRHFGLRLVEAPDGAVFATLGERGTGPGGFQVQYPTRSEGKVIHLRRDGSPATELPERCRGSFRWATATRKAPPWPRMGHCCWLNTGRGR